MTSYKTIIFETPAELRDWINTKEFIEIKLIEILDTKYNVFYKKDY